MSFSNMIKRFKRAAARYGLFASASLIGLLPWGLVKVFMKVMIAIAFQFTIRLKKTAYETLEVAFEGQKSDTEIRSIIKRCFRNLGQAIIELVYFIHHPDKVLNHFSFEGRHHLEEALKEGKGVVCVTAHFGNFALMQMAFAQAGYKTNVLVRRARDKKIAEYVYRSMTKVGVKPIYSMPARQCVQSSLKALRAGEIVFVLLDQNFGSGSGVFVDFFGRKAATGTGPVVFAERAGAPIVPVFNVRQDDDHHRIIIEPPLHIEEKADKEETIYETVVRITRIIEKYIRQYPHEWGWMHRRWKSRPSDVPVKEVKKANEFV